MGDSVLRFSKRRWFLTLCGLFFYVGDISTDVLLALTYFQESQYFWSGMTVGCVLAGLLVTQIFSCAWYWEDVDNTKREGRIPADMSKGQFAALHVFGLGILMRYALLLKEGFKAIWKKTGADEEELHIEPFNMAADLSMLKLFETYLESAPQLLLQLYVRGHNEWPPLQILSLAFSFCNMAWSLVDFRHCFRSSLPHVSNMPSGFPTAVYLLYKLGTITSLILSYSLLLTLSIYSTVVLAVFWVVATTWVHFLNTDFCSSRVLELLYRAVAGVILVFSFFNVKGQNTREAMIAYYCFYCAVCVVAPVLLAFLKPEMQTTTFLWTAVGVIYGGLFLGMLCLVLYYGYLHPKSTEAKMAPSPVMENGTRAADEVDGLKNETSEAVERNGLSKETKTCEVDKKGASRKEETATAKRLRTILQP